MIGYGTHEFAERVLVFEKKTRDGSLSNSYYHCKATDWEPCAKGFEEAMNIGYQTLGTKVTVKFEVTNIRPPMYECLHDNWEYRRGVTPSGFCTDCGKPIELAVLINRLKKRYNDLARAIRTDR